MIDQAELAVSVMQSHRPAVVADEYDDCVVLRIECLQLLQHAADLVIDERVGAPVVHRRVASLFFACCSPCRIAEDW